MENGTRSEIPGYVKGVWAVSSIVSSGRVLCNFCEIVEASRS